MPITNNLGQTRVGIRKQVLSSPSPSYLLDSYGGATAAYSLRKLRAGYTGSAIRVRRSNDNTTLDVGFDANGNLDTTSMLNFVGGQNLYLPSEDLSGFNWGGNGVNRTSNTGVAPDGITPANLLSEQSTLNNHNLNYSVGVSVTAGRAVNHSVYLKKGPGSNAPDIISLYVGNATFNMRAVFNISTGQLLNTTTGNATGFEALITDAGNGWWRCSIGGTLPHTTTQNFLLLTEFCNNVNSTTRQFYLGNVNANVYVWGLQYSNTNSVQPYSKTTTLTAGNGFVSIWYDQSGNSLNLTQVSSALQPKVVNSGSIYTLNGRSIAYFSSNQMNVARIFTTSNFSIFSVLAGASGQNNALVIAQHSGAASLGRTVFISPDTVTSPYNKAKLFFNNGTSYNVVSTGIAFDGTLKLVNSNSNGSGTSTIYVNNANSGTLTGQTWTPLNTPLTVGADGGNGQAFTGYIGEMVMYTTNQLSLLTDISSNINSYYTIY
jgi:hypothetical protein